MDSPETSREASVQTSREVVAAGKELMDAANAAALAAANHVASFRNTDSTGEGLFLVAQQRRQAEAEAILKLHSYISAVAKMIEGVQNAQ